jgi:anaerobic magnesium-protoporphyrin IX monomethyl ester cyclase
MQLHKTSSRSDAKGRVLFIQENGLSESIGLCCLSAYLKAHGFDCDLLLLTHTDNWLQRVRDYAPDLIGFSVFTGMQHAVYEIIRDLKQSFATPVIVGGPHPTFYPQECMEECPDIDFICRGDGEEALLKLVQALHEHTDYQHIPGIWVRQSERILDNAIAPLIQDVNALPIPDRSIYYRHDFLRDFPMKRFISGYHCPYNCGFCNEPWYRDEYLKAYPVPRSAFMRVKTVDRVIAEILQVRTNSVLKRVHFSDDLFAFHVAWLEEFAAKYPQAVGLPFSCNLRLDLIDDRRADLLKQAMCCAVQVGIESGNDTLRNEVIGKQLKRESILRGAQLIRDRGIRLYTTSIVALPGETVENALETIELNQQIKANACRINTLIPFPKTALAEYAVAQGYLPVDYSLKDLNTSDSLHIHCHTPYKNEFQNISCLFLVFVKLRVSKRLISWIIRRKNNSLFRLFGLLNLLQDVRHFDIDLRSGFQFYLNTLFRAKSNQAMHWIPGMKERG